VARASSGALGRLPLRRGDGLSADGVPRPRIGPVLAALALLVAFVAYGVPLVTTGDPLWPLPTDTHADALVVHWDGSATEIRPSDPRYGDLMKALNAAASDIDGIELAYGLRPEDVAAIRARGRALEARYDRPARIHGAHAVGMFTRILVPLAGPEAERHLIFFGDQSGYRAGPLRARSLDALVTLAERASR